MRKVVVYGNPGGTGNRVLQGLITEQITVTAVDGIYVQVQGHYNYDPIFDLGIPTFGFGDGPISFDIDMTASAKMAL